MHNRCVAIDNNVYLKEEIKPTLLLHGYMPIATSIILPSPLILFSSQNGTGVIIENTSRQTCFVFS